MTQLQLPHHIDATMMSCFRSCPQKYFREFVEGYRPPGISIDLHAGGCFSEALEEVYHQVFGNGKSLDDALLMAEARFFQQWGDVEPPEWKITAKTKDRVWEAVEGYFQTWAPLTDDVRPYVNSVIGRPTYEYTFAIPLDPDDGFPTHPEDDSPFVYCGRFDMLAEIMSAKRIAVKDDKTTGSISRNWAEQWNLRSQFIGYVWACQQAGLDVDTTVVRGIGILKEKLTFVEAIKPYSRYVVELWYNQLKRDMWRLRRCWDDGYFDYNLAETCTNYGLCPFLTSCASSNPDSWLTEFEVRHWNPLYKNPVETNGSATRTF